MYTPIPEEQIAQMRAHPEFPRTLDTGLRTLEFTRNEYTRRGGPFITPMGDAPKVDRWVATLYGITEFANYMLANNMFMTATDRWVGCFTVDDITALRDVCEARKYMLTATYKALLVKEDYELADFMSRNMVLHGMPQLFRTTGDNHDHL